MWFGLWLPYLQLSSCRWWISSHCLFLQPHFQIQHWSYRSWWSRVQWHTLFCEMAHWWALVSWCRWTRYTNKVTVLHWLTSTAMNTGPHYQHLNVLLSTRCTQANAQQAYRSRVAISTWQHRIPDSGPACAPRDPNVVAGPLSMHWIGFQSPATAEEANPILLSTVISAILVDCWFCLQLKSLIRNQSKHHSMKLPS